MLRVSACRVGAVSGLVQPGQRNSRSAAIEWRVIRLALVSGLARSRVSAASRSALTMGQRRKFFSESSGSGYSMVARVTPG